MVAQQGHAVETAFDVVFKDLSKNAFAIFAEFDALELHIA